LSGPTGAVLWWLGTLGSMAALVFAWFVLQRALTAKELVDPLLLKIPVLGTCLRNFAIARFSWAYFLTQQSGMPVARSLQSSLRATANGAFTGATGEMCSAVQEGSSVTEAFAATRLFPEDYLAMVSVAEESGTVPEALRRLSPQFEENARRSLKALTSSISVLVWLALAGFVVMFVFRFALWYVAMLQNAASGKF
jgi:type IV pilus assembly protein PilC